MDSLCESRSSDEETEMLSDKEVEMLKEDTNIEYPMEVKTTLNIITPIKFLFFLKSSSP